MSYTVLAGTVSGGHESVEVHVQATYSIVCRQCKMPVEQKVDFGIIAPGIFDLAIEACPCGSIFFDIKEV